MFKISFAQIIKTIFDLALTSGDVDAVDNGLTALAKIIEGDAGLSRALKSPLYKSEEKAAVLADLGQKLNLPELARRFVGVSGNRSARGNIAVATATAAARAFGVARNDAATGELVGIVRVTAGGTIAAGAARRGRECIGTQRCGPAQ